MLFRSNKSDGRLESLLSSETLDGDRNRFPLGTDMTIGEHSVEDELEYVRTRWAQAENHTVRLCLSTVPVTVHSVPLICYLLKTSPSLTAIDFEHCAFGDGITDLFAALARNPRLTSVSLRATSMSVVGAQALANALIDAKNRTIRCLDLSWNSISAAAPLLRLLDQNCALEVPPHFAAFVSLM